VWRILIMGESVHHFDVFYSLYELPEDEQREHADWAAPDEQFVRMVYDNGREEFIPLENFMRHTRSPVGHKIDGFATDSYFSGTALRLLTNRDKYATDSDVDPDADYEIWMESW
jgi:hypothetical protein